MKAAPARAKAVLEPAALAQLFEALVRRGYQVAGPTVRDGAIVCDVLENMQELPAGCADEQAAGRYRLERNGGAALFGFASGAQGWKRLLHPPEVRVFHGKREGDGFQILNEPRHGKPLAFIGVRACDLAALRIHDRVFLEDRYVEPGYRARREGLFIVAVNCTHPARTCFCASMGAGPAVNKGFDLCLTELCDGKRHIYVVQSGSKRGTEVLGELQSRAATTEELADADFAVERAGEQERSLDLEGLRDLLYESFDHPRWEKTAARCFSCGNCTLVCPTCFCSTTEDSSDVTCETAERWKKWDSCFTETFSYIHGGSVRLSVKARYRQWLTHKLAAWQDQFGTTGCVGCGRCITWCPGKIDLTEEVAALRGVAGGPMEGRDGN